MAALLSKCSNNGRLTLAPVLFVGKTSAEDPRWAVSVSGKLILRTEIPYKSCATSSLFPPIWIWYTRNFFSVEQARINENFSSVSRGIRTWIRCFYFFFFFFFRYTVNNSGRNFEYARYSELFLGYIYIYYDFFLASRSWTDVSLLGRIGNLCIIRPPSPFESSFYGSRLKPMKNWVKTIL